MIDDLIEMKNSGYEVFREKYPKLCDFVWKYATDKNFGVQFKDDEGNVTEEYTLYTNNIQISGYDEGLIDCDLVVTMAESYAKQFIDEFDDIDGMGDVLKGGMRFLPTLFGATIRGDFKLKRG